MSTKFQRTLVLTAAVVSTLAGWSSAQTPSFGISVGLREGTASTTIGTASAATGSIEWIVPNGITVPADGLYHDITFNLGTDPSANFAGTAGAGTTSGVLDGAYVGLEHLRILNTQGITKPVSLFIDDVTSTSGASSVVVTDFQTIPSAIANNTSNVLFRDPSISGSTTPNFARNFISSTVVNTQPDGTTDAAKQALRQNFRFNIPEVVTSSTGWGRSTSSTSPAVTPAVPTIYGVGSTLTMRIAIVVNNPLYGFNKQGATDNWTDNENWGNGTGAGSINAPNSTTATALFDEPLPASGPATPRTIVVDTDVKMQNLQFTTQVPYTLNGPGTVIITRSAVDYVPTLNVEAGSHTINAPVRWQSDSTAANQASYAPVAWVSTGASVTLTQTPIVNRYVQSTTAGAPAINSFTKRGGGTLSVPDMDVDTMTVTDGTMAFSPATSSTLATLTLGSSIVTGNAKAMISPTAGATKTVTTLSITANRAATLGGNVAAGDVAIGTANVGQNATLALDFNGASAGVVKVGSLNLNVTSSVTTAKLDLGNDGVLYDYAAASTTVPATVKSLILLGYNSGDWLGKGYTSSLLSASDTTHAIGYKPLLTGDSFMGRTAADDSTIAFRYTLRGDSNLDGAVNFGDLLILAANYNGTALDWSQGDSNYDGEVNFSDLLSLAANYNQTITGSFAGDWALAQSAVPEPMTLTGLAGASLLALRRRRA
ncbi:MAG: hypothetical protein QM770_23920 [Tepidisphaeraceae bacterium]